jgi:hypothetical protein
VPDPAAALAEVRRVVAPGGRLALIEHVAAPPSRPLLGLGQRLFDPLQGLVADGCAASRGGGMNGRHGRRLWKGDGVG